MDSRYRRADAEKAIEKYAAQYGDELALRVYTSRLLGQEPELVLHGGGNTSVKSRITEIGGDSTEVIYVKGSGWDLATIEPRGFPACRLARLRRACELPGMTDEQMVAELRGQMIDPTGPTPSVEALLHAFLPAKFVDHTHADSILAIVDQPDSERLVREIFGDRALFVPYVMPGFLLAKKIVELWRVRMLGGSEPTVMILDKHGIFTWGATALESYERMIANVTRAERHLSDSHARSRRTLAAPNTRACEALAPIVRGALTRLSGQPWVLTWRTSFPVISFCERNDLDVVSQIGCITPDHVIRTKPRPLVLHIDDAGDPQSSRIQIETRIASYAAAYREYFRRSTHARGVMRKELDPFPRVFLFQDLGMLAAGKTWNEAEIVADIYEHTASVIDCAMSLGRYQPVGELDLFDVEYWSLEQAKLGKPTTEGLLDRKIVLVTGAASGIGFATASAMLAAGAHVVMTDKDIGHLDKAVLTLSTTFKDRVWSCLCDVSSAATVTRAIRQTCMRFGGLDVVVSNAGTAFGGALHTDAGDSALKASLDVNLLGHQNVAKAAASTMLAQNAGGVLLFNASKSAFSPGPDFGPYAVPKAALIALMRQYAVDLAAFGIRSNAVNADRIRTDLFSGGVLEARARARGVDVDEYFKGNLLRRETTAEDVAQAFVFLATAQATTGCVLTVDGGNPAAFPR